MKILLPPCSTEVTTHDFCGTGIRANEGRDCHMETSTESKIRPPSIPMLSMPARQVGEHPEGLNHLQVAALWERTDKGAQISASISEYKYCGGNGVGHGRQRNRQILPGPPNPFVSTVPSQCQQHSACPGCTTDWNHIEIKTKKRKIEQGWHQMLYCQYTKAVLHLFGCS